MIDLLPRFSWDAMFVAPWTDEFGFFIWIALMGFFVTAACGLIGNYLILRRMALIGDAISHSVLPGIAIAFLVSSGRGSIAMFVGALIAGVLTTVIIETIHSRSRIKQDSAIGITFSCFFAVGVILVSLYAGRIELDADCVLFGEIGYVPLDYPYATLGAITMGPPPVARMALVLAATALLIVLFYKELLISSFDPQLASAQGLPARAMHYCMMSVLSVVVVSAFEAVGAILVIAMLVLPGATAALLSRRLWVRLLLTLIYAALSSVAGIHLALALDSSVAPSMVVSGCGLFALAWLVSPFDGLRRLLPSRRRASASREAAPDPV